ncbi:DUF3344 domain-containing protein [uncultured Methanobrevibacter sp.]|uniref:DUF3344 domain-containing protein n=1 Tax=uncultured Methanobrevibacter sp. TaxID=253161 RepID=UPI0025F8873D|nr:DUF3344 domain-containing protein [uncultured Methanobrevibacter sp.]
MRIKKMLFISIFVFMMVLSIGAVSAEDADDAIVSSDEDIVLTDSEPVSGTVSGDVDVVTENPWSNNGELSYDIPSDAKTIKSADVYVNVYSGSAQPTYGANANVTITTNNGKTNYSESLWIEDGSTDGTVYPVNDHTTKCYSDYMIHYDITSLLNGLNGSSLKINVDTFQMDGKQFDGKIKLIALVLAYDDGDDDSIGYWINSEQLWSKSNVNVTFNTESLTNIYGTSLINVVLSSGDGVYRINNEIIGDADTHQSGNYYQYNKWNDVSSFIKANDKNTLNVAYAGTSAYGSIKNVLSVLTVNSLITDLSLKTEYTSVPSAYAGTNNTLTVTVSTNKAGKYTLRLLADNVLVSEIEQDLISGSNTVLLTDPTIRAVDETTVNGATNNKVNYTVSLIFEGNQIKNESVVLPILYNGNLGKDLAYPSGGYESFSNITINGDIVIDVKDVASYLGAAVMNREDVWTINLDSKSSIVKSYIYVPYNWFNPNLATEDISMFNTTFNGVKVIPVAFYRDQGNLGNYGKYGYGVLVYDVTDLTKTGENSFNLTKLAKTPAVYPSVLVYMYNTTGSAVVKNVYISNGADLLAGTSNNIAKRPVHSDSTIDVTSIADTAKLYILAASAQAGEGNIVFNGQTYENVWSGTSSSTELYELDITDSVKNSNNISFVATGSTILALQQIIVTTQKAPTVITAPSATVVYGNAKNLVVTLKDVKGNAIVNAKISVVLNGKSTTLNTNAKGQATLAIPTNLVPKTYALTINYAGDDTHIKSSLTTTKVTVKKASVKLTAKKAIFKAKKKSKKYTVTLKNNKGKAMKKVKLTLKVKGKTYKATTNAKGKAIFKLKLTKKGTFKAKITYKGDKYFNKLVKTVKIKVKR